MDILIWFSSEESSGNFILKWFKTNCLHIDNVIILIQLNSFKCQYLKLIILLNINHVCTQWSGYTYCYLTLIILFTIFIWTLSNGSKYCYVSLTIQLNIICLHTYWISESSIWPYQVLPLWVRMNLGVMAMKGTLYSLELQDRSFTIRLFSVIFRTFFGEGFAFSPEVQSTYFIVSSDWEPVWNKVKGKRKQEKPFTWCCK